MNNKNILLLVVLALLGLVVFNYYRSEAEMKVLSVAEENEQLEVETVEELNEEYVIDESDMYEVDRLTEENGTVLSQTEIDWLLLMREEEKLARDVYQFLGETWGDKIFFNIAASEQTHTDAVKDMIAFYDLTDPVASDYMGQFTNPQMQKLYNDLTQEGSKSLVDALKVGALIEDLDIKDLDQAISETEQENIIVAYKNLQKGSRNHLRAFVKKIERMGGDYEPTYISNAEYQSIVSSGTERGRI